MIVYLDSSVLARAYLPDEQDHEAATALLGEATLAAVTGTWSRIEVTGALVRAARRGRGDEQTFISALDSDLGLEGRVAVVTAPQDDIERAALDIVRHHGLRAMDAWHLALARLVLPDLAEGDEPLGFASRDVAQAAAAQELGFVRV